MIGQVGFFLGNLFWCLWRRAQGIRVLFCLSILVSSASVSHIFALQSLLQDQDILFGPHEAQFTAIAEANLKRKEDELTQAQVDL